MSARAVARLVAAGTLTGLALLMWSAPAAAEVSGNCDAVIKGVSAHDVSSSEPDQAIKVKQDETVAYSVASSVGITSRRFVMEYGGFSFVVDKGTNKGDDSFSSGDAAVKDYAWAGAGLYKVRGEATLKGGTTCSGAVLINVEGNPLTTVAGIIGGIAVITGAIGTIATSGTKTGEIIDELVNFFTGPDAPDPATAPGGGGGLLTPTAGHTPGDGTQPGETGAAPVGTDGTKTGTETGEEPPPRKGRRDAVPGGAGGTDPVVPTTGTTSGGTVPPEEPSAPPTSGRGQRGGSAHTPPPVAVPTDGSDPSANGTGGTSGGTGQTGTAGESGEPAPPPLPGMGLVTGTGKTADALIEAHETLTNAIGQLPISEDQQTKLTETLGLDKIKDKLDQVKEVTDTVTHFEAVGTETVDTLNRWGVPPKMVEAVLWTRWTMEASGRAGQKFTDGLVTPVLEPVTKAMGEAGVKADATEIAHTLLPVQEFAEEASKAAMTSVKNVLGGDNIVGQLGKDPVVDEEWANIRTFK